MFAKIAIGQCPNRPGTPPLWGFPTCGYVIPRGFGARHIAPYGSKGCPLGVDFVRHRTLGAIHSKIRPSANGFKVGNLLRASFRCQWGCRCVLSDIVMPDPGRCSLQALGGPDGILGLKKIKILLLWSRAVTQWVLRRDAKSGRSGRYICAIFSQLVLIFGLCTRTGPSASVLSASVHYWLRLIKSGQ